MHATLSHELLEHVIDFLAEPVFVKDNDHRVIHANQAFYDIFRMKEADVIGYTLAEAVPPHEREHFLRVDRHVLDTGEPDLREEELTVEGVTHTIVTSKRRYVDPDGNHFLIGSIHDVSELKDAQARLEREKTKLETALSEITTLRGILPICSYCKRIRNDCGEWTSVESYISRRSAASFSHGICDDCFEKLPVE